MVIASFSEAITLGSVLPFLAMMTEPTVFLSGPISRYLPKFLLGDVNLALLYVTLFFGLSAIASGALRLLLMWFGNRLSYQTGSDISLAVYRRILYQPFNMHLEMSSGDVINGIVNKAGTAINVLSLSVNLFAAVLILISILLTLFLINTPIALMIFIFFGVTYIVIAKYSKRKLIKYGKEITFNSSEMLKALQEGLGGIRDVILDGRQEFYCGLYRKVELPNRIAQGKVAFISLAPRWVLESFGIAFIAILAYAFSTKMGTAGSLSVLGVFAMGAQRMLPALQQIYGSWAGIQAGRASLIDTLNILEEPINIPLEISEHKTISFQNSITLNDIWFRYSNAGPWVLNGVSMEVLKGDCIGFVGKTGCGKSTLADILMGLLNPSLGSLQIDNCLLDSSFSRSWQAHIAHVPQSIFMTDATLLENVAFGIPLDEIDTGLVIEAIKGAQLWDMVQNNPDGLMMKIGERGIRLSGGQRQRIGIARALYKQSEVIIFDEATSALDVETEKSVMDVLYSLQNQKTIFIIAHRLSTLKGCGKIARLNNGIIEEITTYDALASNL